MTRIFLFVGLMALSSTNAYAQYQNSVYIPPYNPGLQLLNDSIRAPSSDEDDSNNGEAQNNSSNNVASPTISASLTFTPTAARTRKNLQAFADNSRAADPAGADQMEQLFASTDIIGQIGDLMGAIGLKHNNAADAYAIYWISAWKATRGDTSNADAETYQAVAAQVARGLSTSPEFANATDAQKQEMAEAMMIQAAMIDAHMESAAGNPQQLQAVADAVAQGAKASGLELNKMELSDEGFAKAD